MFRTDRNQTFRDGVLVSEEIVEVDITAEVNSAALSDRDAILARMAALKAFLEDPDVTVAFNVTNTTALTVVQQNRLNKELIRQARRNANATLRLFRYTFGQLHPELLDDITDT